MCVVRNKRKLPAKRYRGVAKVACRRARKGFNLKFNPDAHYSSAMYKILDKLQLSDGSDKVVLNRDDQQDSDLTLHIHIRSTNCYFLKIKR